MNLENDNQKQKEIFAKNLQYWLKVKNKNQMDLMNDLNLSSSTVSDWCNAKKYPRMGTVQMLADYLNILKSDLIENKVSSSVDYSNMFFMCPVYEKFSDKEPYFIDSNIKGRIILDTNVYNITKKYEYFSIKINENYTNFRNTHGNYIIFQREDYAKDDDIILIIIDNALPSIKKYKKVSDTLIVLQPIDLKDYIEPLVIDTTNTNIKILGKAIGFFGKMEINK